KAIQMALSGDNVALRLCLDRIYPPRKDRPLRFALPPITNARDAPEIISAIAAAVTSGDITPSEASEIAKLIDSYVKAYQTTELNDRIARVEQLSDAELMRIATGKSEAETTARVSRLLTIGSR